MLGLQFKDYENEIRQHLSGMLPKDLFEFGRDVEREVDPGFRTAC
jgi:hypothetical protein